MKYLGAAAIFIVVFTTDIQLIKLSVLDGLRFLDWQFAIIALLSIAGIIFAFGMSGDTSEYLSYEDDEDDDKTEHRNAD